MRPEDVFDEDFDEELSKAFNALPPAVQQRMRERVETLRAVEEAEVLTGGPFEVEIQSLIRRITSRAIQMRLMAEEGLTGASLADTLEGVRAEAHRTLETIRGRLAEMDKDGTFTP